MAVDPGDRAGRLIKVQSGDHELDGAWYPLDRDEAWTGLLHLHGKGGNFYSGPGRFLAESPLLAEYGHLSLNMQCHDLGYTLGGVDHPDPHDGYVEVAGGMWEDISQGHHDVAAGVSWLRDMGASRVFVTGHSSGGFYAAQASAQGVRMDGIVLMSPVISHRRHMHRWFPGRDLDEVRSEAESLMASGQGHVLFPTETWYYAISATSLVERFAEPNEQLSRHLTDTSQPLLMICGSLENRVEAWRQVMDRIDHVSPGMTVIEGVDHSYKGGENEVGVTVRDFVSSA